MKRAGADVGGTFTDVAVIDEAGTVSSHKVPSDPARLADGVASALSSAVTSEPDALEFIGHGTTVPTNVTLERSGPRVAFLATRGFKDIVEIARLAKPSSKLYVLKNAVPPPFVQRRDSFDITERVNPRGEVVTALNEREVEDAARAALSRGIEAIAVCFLFSFRNPLHEQRARDIIGKVSPDIHVSLSCEVWPEFREYERAVTTILNCYLQPATSAYLGELVDVAGNRFSDAQLWVMQSNGGLTSPSAASAFPVRLVMSGPAGGVIGARHLAERTGLADLITIDMGGTSFDVSLLRDGHPTLVEKQDVMGLPLQGRSLDILSVGAGGGSIAWVDRAGQFKVGPRSAGAFPGPACYGRGGDEPTVTDANLVIGLLDSEVPIAGGELVLDYGKAYKACAALGAKLGMTAIETALGIRQIVNTSMAGAMRSATVRRGLDPRDFAVLAYGGAGPLHAADLAAELGNERICVPRLAGCFSALGIAMTDVAHDLVYTESAVADTATLDDAAARLDDLIDQGSAELLAAGVERRLHDFECSLDLRYQGQNSALNVPVHSQFQDVKRNDSMNGERVRVMSSTLAGAVIEFHREHERQFGYGSKEHPVEVLNLRVRALGRVGRQSTPPDRHPPPYEAKPQATRPVNFSPEESTKTNVHHWADLSPGASLTGPAIISSPDTTVAVPPHATAWVDAAANLHLRRSAQ